MGDYTATERKRRQRLREKLEKEKQDPLDLNAGMKPVKDVFPSMEDWLEANPDKTSTDYIRLKIAWNQEKAENERKLEEQDEKEWGQYMTLVPFNPQKRKDCSKFRSAYLTFNLPNESLSIQNHNAICEHCARWLREYAQKVSIGGVTSLW